MAPETIVEDYGLKADVWSCGVIAFMALAGFAPFEGEDQAEIFDAVLEGFDRKYQFADPVWDDVSEEAKDFIECLLTYEEELRPTPGEALKHPFMERAR